MPHFTIEREIGLPHICGVDEAGRGPWAGPVVAAAVMFCPSAIAKFCAPNSATGEPSPLGGEGWVRGCDDYLPNFASPHPPSPRGFGGRSPSLLPQGEKVSPAAPLCICSAPCTGDSIPSGLNDSKKLSRAAREKLFAALMDAQITHGIGIATAEEIDQLNIWQATQLAMRRAMAALPIAPDFALIDGNLKLAGLPCDCRPIIGGDGISLSIAAASILAKVTRDRMMDDYARDYPQYGFDRHAGYGTKAHQEALAAHGVCPIHRTSYAPIRAILEREAA